MKNSLFDSLFLVNLCVFIYIYIYIYVHMFMCSVPYLCLDLHIDGLHAMFMPRSISLCPPCHVHVSRSTYWLLCHVLLKPFYLFLCTSFLCFGPLGRV